LLLAIDISNSTIKAGIFNQEKLIASSILTGVET
jgi:sugar (pentulose or hexulose) kinase